MKFRVQSVLFDRFAGLSIGLVIARDIDNRNADDRIPMLLRRTEAELRDRLTLQGLSDEPRITAWRFAYASFGAKPKKHLSSIEALCRTVLSGNEVRTIHPVVDIYNAVSLKHLLPVGGDDLDKVEGDIVLRLAAGGESFTALNSVIPETPRPGEVIYSDDRGVLSRRWNWREANKTKMTEETENVVLFTEGLPPANRDRVIEAAAELADMIRRFCGGDVRREVVDRAQTEIIL